jgi:hypothetical protein
VAGRLGNNSKRTRPGLVFFLFQPKFFCGGDAWRPDLPDKNVTIDEAYVRGWLTEIMQKEDLSKIVL